MRTEDMFENILLASSIDYESECRLKSSLKATAAMKSKIQTFVALVAILSSGCNRATLVPPFEQERVELTYETDGGKFYVVDDGNAYRETQAGEAWELVMRVRR